MENKLEKFVCKVIIYDAENGNHLRIIFNRESLDDVLNIERDSSDNDQYIRIGDTLTISEIRYKVTGARFSLSEYKLNETREMKGDSAYSETPPTPTNCEVAFGVERLD